MDIPPVPCYWPGCHETIVLNYLGRHLVKKHGVVSGFGCQHCGFIATGKDVVRNHILQHHGSKEEPRRADRALALYYRQRFQQDDPTVRDLPLSAFWGRGRKHKSETAGRCPKCNNVIAPYTGANLIRHLCTNHIIIIDLDFARVSSSHAVDMLPIDIDHFVISDNEPDPDEQEDSSRYFDENDEDEKEEGEGEERAVKNSGKSISDGLRKELVSHRDTTEVSKPASMRDQNADNLRSIFMSCIKEESVEDFEKTLEMYETRAYADGTYRVNKKLSLNTELDSHHTVCAVLMADYWRCEVPQCGAILHETFAIDVHLRAHDAIFLTRWYCGDVSCYTGLERIFHSRASFDSHVASEHMGSSYSVAAGRRVPKQEVLITSLMNHMRFTPLPIKRSNYEDEDTRAPVAFAVGEVREEANSEWEEYDPDDAVECDSDDAVECGPKSLGSLEWTKTLDRTKILNSASIVPEVACFFRRRQKA